MKTLSFDVPRDAFADDCRRLERDEPLTAYHDGETTVSIAIPATGSFKIFVWTQGHGSPASSVSTRRLEDDEPIFEDAPRRDDPEPTLGESIARAVGAWGWWG